MKDQIIESIMQDVLGTLNNAQMETLRRALIRRIPEINKSQRSNSQEPSNSDFLSQFLAAKSVEGRSPKTLRYYEKTIDAALNTIGKAVREIQTDDLRKYMVDYCEQRNSSRVTMDNIRRILSSFFGWLEDEDLIIKSPVRRIHKVKISKPIKETYTDEELEQLRDNCSGLRDLAIIDLLASTGMRVGELVKLTRKDVDFNERECRVFGKGDKARIVYFDARTKLHLQSYLYQRADEEDALFVSLKSAKTPITIGTVESRLRELGKSLGIEKVYPHKFRRTLATTAIDKGMPIEQVQRLLGHERIDTTMHYALVNQSNVKSSHRRFLG